MLFKKIKEQVENTLLELRLEYENTPPFSIVPIIIRKIKELRK